MKITRKEFEDAIKLIEAYKKQVSKEYNEVIQYENTVYHPNTRFIDVEFSIRLRNILYYHIGNYHKTLDTWNMKLSDLSVLSISDIKKERGFGAKTLSELIELCAKAGIKLKQ